MENVNLLFFNHAEELDTLERADVSPVKAVAEAASRIANHSFFAIDFDRHELVFRTEELLYLNEATLRDFKRKCANPYWALISEETLRALVDIRSGYPELSNTMSVCEYQNHMCVIDYPIMIGNHELYITQKFTPLQLRKDGITKLGLFTVSHSNKKQIECIVIAPNGRRFVFNFGKRKFDEFELDSVLTKTEKIILHRARMGLSNGEIAKSLFISVNTVKSHRTHIFEKLNVSSITEAIAVAGNYKLL